MAVFNVPLKGRIEPGGPLWAKATPADRLAFYSRAGEVAVRVLRAQLMRGVGADGKRMAPRQHPRADGATGPVLSPHGAESRTERLMDFHAWENGVTVFWRSGHSKAQKLPWAKILSFHADGLVIGAYLRDVRPSLATVKKIAAEMATWWKTRQRVRNGPSAKATPGGKPKPVAAAGLDFVPSYHAKREPVVVVDVKALERGWRKDGGYHVPPGGGADRQKYRNAVAFIEKAKRESIPVEMPRVTVAADGTVSFVDGRHRFAALRDAGAARIPVTVDRPDAARAARLYGAKGAGGRKFAPRKAKGPAAAPAPAPTVAPKATTRPYGSTPEQRAEAERTRAALAAYAEGDRKVKALQDLGEVQRAKEARVAHVGRLAAEAEEAVARYAAGPAGNPEYAAAREQLLKLQTSLADARFFAEKAKAAARAAAAGVLKVATPMEFYHDRDKTAKLPEATRGAVASALDFLGKVTAAGGKQTTYVEFRPAPRKDGRAYYDGGGKVRLTPESGAPTVVHELGHLLEDAVPGWLDRAKAFLGHRTEGEEFVSMRSFDPGYGPYEFGRSDDFGKAFGEGAPAAYVGKDYHDATEITSMALERLMDDPAGFAQNDPEYCKWLIGMLHGDLR